MIAIVQAFITFTIHGTKLSRLKIAERISGEIGFSKSDALELVDSILETISDNISSEKGVKIPGFGNFSTIEKRERKGTSPKDGSKITIKQRKVVSFKASVLLREKIND